MLRTTPIPPTKGKQIKPKPEQSKRGRGRPTKFTVLKERQVIRLTKAGWTVQEIADFLELSYPTVWHWRKKNPDFFNAVKGAKEQSDEPVKVALRESAMGYSHPEEKIFCNALGEVTTVQTIKHYPPNSTSLIFWLCNRDPEHFKRNTESKPEGEKDIDWNNIGFRAAGETDFATDSPSGAIAAAG